MRELRHPACFVLCAAFAACSNPTPSGNDAGADAGPDAGTDAGTDAGFDAGAFAVALESAAAAHGLYSISFDEQGPFLLAGFFVTPDLAPDPAGCGTVFSPVSGPGWELELWVPQAAGTYAVGPSNSDEYPPRSGAAVVALVRYRTASAPSVEVLPTEGQVIVTSAPAAVSDQTGGAHMQGSFHLGFPADPLQPYNVHCSGGSGSHEVCDCDDWAGNQVSVCDGGGPDCCLSSAPAVVFADATFDALPCDFLCAAPSYSECAPLFPDGGLPGGG